MLKIHFNSAFEGLNESDLELWKIKNYKKLIGSALFTKNNSIVSRLVSWIERKHYKESTLFSPSHVGSIIEYNDDLYVFNMRPLKAYIVPLTKYISETSDDFVLAFRNFKLNTEMFSKNIAEHIGQPYPFMSAIRSVFDKKETKWKTHCSELHLRELQKQGLFTEINPEITPLELYKIIFESV